jgi:hypothetical protein
VEASKQKEEERNKHEYSLKAPTIAIYIHLGKPFIATQQPNTPGRDAIVVMFDFLPSDSACTRRDTSPGGLALPFKSSYNTPPALQWTNFVQEKTVEATKQKEEIKRKKTEPEEQEGMPQRQHYPCSFLYPCFHHYLPLSEYDLATLCYGDHTMLLILSLLPSLPLVSRPLSYSSHRWQIWKLASLDFFYP